jgi:hypothetical protein
MSFFDRKEVKEDNNNLPKLQQKSLNKQNKPGRKEKNDNKDLPQLQQKPLNEQKKPGKKVENDNKNLPQLQQKPSNEQKKPGMKEKEKNKEQMITGVNTYVKLKMQQVEDLMRCKVL